MSSPQRPTCPLGRPSVIFSQVLPASAVLYRPECGPNTTTGSPPEKASRRTCQAAAYSTLESVGSIFKSMAPVFSSQNWDTCQVLPPSVVLKMPRSLLGPQVWPIAATYTVSGLRGSMAMRPMECVSLRPMCCQVLPPSTDL